MYSFNKSRQTARPQHVIYIHICLCLCVVSKSAPSAENTINRPRQTQSGPGHANTLHVDRGLHQPPPYTSSASLTTPYHGLDDAHGRSRLFIAFVSSE